MSSYYGQSSSRSLWTESSGHQQSQIYADPLNNADEDYYYDANDQNRLDLLKLILYDLNSAIAPREARLMAIQAALDEFDHGDEVLHDEELDLRADHILLQKLAYAMCIDPSSDEVGYICSALEMVYRAGRTRLAQSFHEVCDALLPLIVEMIRPPLPGKNSANKHKGSTAEEELVSNSEEKRDLLDGENSLNNNPFMEPVDPLHAHRRFTYGDSDESSAESVQIPSGTGEYFEQMNRAKQEANNVAQTDQGESQSHSASQELVSKPIELGVDAIVPVSNMGGEVALESYKPVSNPRRRSFDTPEDTIRRDLENADEALRRLTSVESQESKDLVPANYNGGGLVAVNSNGGVPIESESRTKRLSALTMGSDEYTEQDEVMYLRGGGSGSVSGSDDASGNDSEVKSRFGKTVDDVPLFDPSSMKPDAQSSAYEDSSVYGSVLYPESSDNPFSDVSDYKKSDKMKDHEFFEEGDFDLGGGFSGSTPQIRPLGESVQVTDTYAAGYDADEAKISISDHEEYQKDMNNGEFDVEGGFSGSAPQIRPLGESVQVTDPYNSAGYKVDEEDEEENTHRPAVDDAKDLDGSEFDVGGGFSGSTPHIRPLGESVQVTDTYGINYGDEEEVSYLQRKRQSELTDDWGSRRESELVDHQENKRDEDWESRRQSELDEWSERHRRQSELTDNFSADQDEYLQRLNRVEEEESHDPTFRSSGVEEDIFQFGEPQKVSQSIGSETFLVPEQGDEYVCQLAIQKVLKILRYFSRVLSAMELLAQQPGLVDSLLYRMKKTPHSNDENEISARVDAIAVVVNLACAEENKIMLVYHPGLLDAVINIANHDPIEEAREHAAIVLMNLAYAEENKVHMVNQDYLLDTLVHLLSDVSPFTRRYSSVALFTLACTYANTAVMTRHCDGGILEALRKVLLNDPIDEARVNAAEALFNMARNNSDDTIENMGNHPKLLASLAHSVLTDYSADVRAYSARALEWLSADIHHPMPCHGRLLKALTTASQWTKTTCIAEALKMQATLAENRQAMVQHAGLLDALATLALLDGINDDEVKTCAIAALERLSKESSTRHIMVKNEGVMTALTKATFAKDRTDDDDATEEDGTPAALLMKTALKNLAAHL
ncbi:hypothetical protein ACHAXM_011359 [Skeletonema potamos]